MDFRSEYKCMGKGLILVLYSHQGQQYKTNYINNVMQAVQMHHATNEAGGLDIYSAYL